MSAKPRGVPLWSVDSPPLRAWLNRRIPRSLKATLAEDDIIQATWVTWLRQRRSSEAEIPDPPLITTIAKRNLFQAIRRSARLKWGSAGCLHAAITRSAAEFEIEQDELLNILREELKKLPKEQGEAIRLHYLEGLSIIEVATSTASTKAAVNGLLHRGLGTLRRRMRAGGGR